MVVDERSVAEVPVLYGLPPIWGTPSPSPFVIKLETWLRMAAIPYRRGDLLRPPRSPTRKIPYLEMPDGRLLHDSELVIATLGRERKVDLDAGLDPAARATGHAVRRMVEESLYFCGLYDRWITPDGFAHVARDYFRHLPWPLRWVIPRIVRRRMRHHLEGQGLGRHPPPVIAAKARDDVDALAGMLGDREFLLGPEGGRPATVDATLTGFLWAFSANPFPSAVGAAVADHANLRAYLARMQALYWSDGPASQR